MTRLDAAKARACAGMREERARAQAALLALRKMLRGYLEAREEFGYNLAGRAAVVTAYGWTISSMRAQERQKEQGGGEGNHLPCVA